MTNLNNLFYNLRYSIRLQQRNFQTPGILRSCSSHSKIPKKFVVDSQITKKDENALSDFKNPSVQAYKTLYWNEGKATKQLKRQNTYPRNVTNPVDLANGLVRFRKNFPGTLKSFVHWLKRLKEERQLIEQKFLPRRYEILKPDLAAAHFLVKRGGAVKFVGQTLWVSMREKSATLPNTYIPGMFVEEMSLEHSCVCYEGLQNISDLIYLNSLSLKNLEQVNDWWLDWISSEYYATLKHLDLTNCKNVTYRGLSCFYRFENLEILNVEGIPDSPEFKLACIMLQDLMPELNITGIDLNLPEEIKAIEVKEDNLSQKVNAIQGH